MTFPAAAGHPQASGFLIPTIWSSRIVEKFYQYTVYQEIANTHYEGEIQAYGDKVNIRTRPDIAVNDYVKGQPLKVSLPEVTLIPLVIDKGNYWNIGIEFVDSAQADYDYMEDWTTEAVEKNKEKIDANVQGGAYLEADSNNVGTQAGKVSGNIDIGATGSELALTKTNVLDYIVDCGTILDEQNVPSSNRWKVLPSKVCGLISKSDLRDASLAGDETSILRNGQKGMIDEFVIYKSNQVGNSSGTFYPMFGHKSALTFAAQLTHAGVLDSETTFALLARGLFVYGWKVVNPKALGHGAVTA